MKYIPWLLMQAVVGVVAVVGVIVLYPFKKSKHVGHDDVYE